MRELFRAATGGLNVLSAIVFGVPLLIVGIALLALPFQPDKRGKYKVRSGDDCGIERVAIGSVIDYIPKESKRAQETSCLLYLLPGQWEPIEKVAALEPKEGDGCKPLRGMLNGRVSLIREPDRFGLNVPLIKVCSVSVGMDQLPIFKRELQGTSRNTP
jgi:hypothetical protein